MTELLEILKSYWWLVLGICAAITWTYKALMSFLHYRQRGEEYLDRQKNRWFWRWFGVGILIKLFWGKTKEDDSTPEKSANKESQ